LVLLLLLFMCITSSYAESSLEDELLIEEELDDLDDHCMYMSY
jgi:hypothetical protein